MLARQSSTTAARSYGGVEAERRAQWRADDEAFRRYWLITPDEGRVVVAAVKSHEVRPASRYDAHETAAPSRAQKSRWRRIAARKRWRACFPSPSVAAALRPASRRFGNRAARGTAGGHGPAVGSTGLARHGLGVSD
jgi:hypothetical protein